jgi:branched-chain amino acid transport system substrate-binding protein
MKRFSLKFALAVAAASVLSLSAARAETGVTDDTITIGGMGPLTGPFTNIVYPMLRAAQLVFEEANAAGGINGRKIIYKLEDDECLPEKAVGAVKKLIYEDKPFMIVGGGCSNAAIAQKSEIIAAKIPWVIVGSTADSLTEPADTYIYASMSAAWMEVYAQLQFAIDQKKQRIAVVWQPDAWGKSRIEPLKIALDKRGIKAIAIEEIPADPTDVTPTALKLKAANPDAVLLLLFPKAAVPYLRDSNKIGLKVMAIGGSPLADIDVLAKGVGSPDGVENLRVVSANGYASDDPQVAQWKEKIEKRYPNDRFNSFHMFGIEAAQFTVAALKKAGRDLTRDKIVEVMSTLEVKSDVDRGPLKCTPDDHQCHRTLGIFALQNGRVTSVGSTTPTR